MQLIREKMLEERNFPLISCLSGQQVYHLSAVSVESIHDKEALKDFLILLETRCFIISIFFYNFWPETLKDQGRLLGFYLNNSETLIID